MEQDPASCRCVIDPAYGLTDINSFIWHWYEPLASKVHAGLGWKPDSIPEGGCHSGRSLQFLEKAAQC